MSPEQWEQVKEWFERLEEIAPDERARLLAEVEDPEVAREAARLLALNDADCLQMDELQPPTDWARDAMDLRAFREGDVAAERFRIVRFLAAGGMGEVYEAEDLELHERVAVKTLRPELALTESAYLRFKQEIQLSRKVTHPNVCRIHDLWRHPRPGGRTTHFLTMELLEGETLGARLSRDGRLGPEEALAMVRQMVDGLEAAHAAGVIHRDLKPGNVMLVGDRVVITDFGLSRSLSVSGATVTGSTLGTPAYMAPEQIEGAETGPATDIYSLGVLIYEMVTGTLPFRGGSAMALAVKKLRETPPPPSSLVDGLPTNWDRAILACLAQEPVFRFQSARALLLALEGQPGAAIPRRPRGRIPTRVWQVAFAAALMVLATLLYWQFRPGYRPAAEAARWYADGVAALHEESPHKARLLLEKAVAADPNYAAAHARLAQAYAELDMADRAREELLRSADLRDEPGGLTDAVRKFVLRDFAEAVPLFQRLEPGAGAVLDTAKAMMLNGDTDGATQRYERVLREEPENPAAWLQLGILQGQLRKTDAALSSFGKAAEAFQLRGNLEGSTAVALRRSEARILTKTLDESDAEVRQVMELARAAGNEYLETAALARLGAVAAYAGRFEEAREIAARAAEKASKTGFANLRARSFYDLGYGFLAQLRYADAEGWFRQCIAVAQEGRMRLTEATAKLGLAQSLIRQSQQQKALPLLEEAAAYLAAAKQARLLFSVRLLAVDALIETGDNVAADAAAAAGLADARRGGRKDEIALMLGRVAHTALSIGDFPRAYLIHHEMRQEYKRVGSNALYLVSLLNEGRLHAVAGDIATAREYVSEAEALLPALAGSDGDVLQSRLHHLKAVLAMAAGNGEAALEEARLAVKLKPAEGAILEARALMALKRNGQALVRAKEALALVPVNTNATDILDFRCGLAEAYFANSLDRDAIRVVTEALENTGSRAQRRIKLQCSLVLRAAMRNTRDPLLGETERMVSGEYNQFTSTWSEDTRRQFRQRADLRRFFEREK